jgi:hypothetical protein
MAACEREGEGVGREEGLWMVVVRMGGEVYGADGRHGVETFAIDCNRERVSDFNRVLPRGCPPSGLFAADAENVR